MMRFTILTLFPEMFEGVINQSIIKRAREKGLIEINLINYRDFATNKHGQVDDYAYGGGAGMVISVEPIHLALTSISGLDKAKKILTSASGYPLTQKKLNELKNEEHLVIVCELRRNRQSDYPLYRRRNISWRLCFDRRRNTGDGPS